MVKTVVEEPVAPKRGSDGPVGAPGVESGKPQRANPVTEHGPNRSWGSDGGVDGMCADRGSGTAAGVDGRGRSGQYRVRKPVHRVGTHSPMATGRGGGDVVGRPLLSVGCIVRMVASPRLALPSTAQGQFVGRSRSWRGDDHGGAGAGGERTLSAAGAAVRRWGLDQPGDFARGRP